jgi:hypothetical protein
MPTQQEHADNISRYSSEAERLLSTAKRDIGIQGGDLHLASVRVQMAGVYADLAKIAAIAAQAPDPTPEPDTDTADRQPHAA